MTKKQWSCLDKSICTCGYWNRDGSLNTERQKEIEHMHAEDCPCVLVDNTPHPKVLWELAGRNYDEEVAYLRRMNSAGTVEEQKQVLKKYGLH